MSSRQVGYSAYRVLVTLFLLVVSAAGTNAAVIVNLLLDPPTTAGPGVTSTRSGPNTWHVYAVDDNTGDFGISSYTVRMNNAVAINQRSPVTTVADHLGDLQTAGFNLLRSATNINPFEASQNLPDQTPFNISGFGQEASDFATKTAAIDPGSSVIGPTTSPTWGTYDTIAPYSGKYWVFLGEGTYNPGIRPAISSASFTVFKNTTTFQSIVTPTVIIPEPTGLPLFAVAGLSAICFVRRR